MTTLQVSGSTHGERKRLDTVGDGIQLSSMSIQIAVRLSDEVVGFLDAEVDAGRGRSRADLIERTLQREVRLFKAIEKLVLVVRSRPVYLDEFDDLVAATSSTPLDIE
jgi:Arc/MetJ-type ribon-helix-helix transcriptional regulator